MNEERNLSTPRHAKPSNSTCASLQDQNKLNETGTLARQPIADGSTLAAESRGGLGVRSEVRARPWLLVESNDNENLPPPFCCALECH